MINDNKPRVLVVGCGNIGISKAIASALMKDLGQVMIVDRPSNVFEIKIPKGYDETINLAITPEREHGWYRCFEKRNKKSRLKR